jgi:hypothetical protein
MNIILKKEKKIPITKMGWWSDSRCRPEFKPQHCKKKKKKTQKTKKIGF